MVPHRKKDPLVSGVKLGDESVVKWVVGRYLKGENLSLGTDRSEEGCSLVSFVYKLSRNSL